MSVSLAHGGLPEKVKAYHLVALIKQVSRSAAKNERISRTAVAVLEYFVSCCREGDFRKGKICGMWEQPATIAARLGISTKVLHNAEAELREKGLIERTSTPHGHRYGDRRNGVIIRLAGISLRPLINGYGRLVAIRDGIELQRQSMTHLCHEIGYYKRQIREAGNEDLTNQADAILPCGRTSRITKIEKLQAIKAALEALLAFIDLPSGDANSSVWTEEIVTPNIPKEDSFKNRSKPGTSQERRNPPASVTPTMAAELASEDYQAVLQAQGGPSWTNIVTTSAIAANSWLRIPQEVWGDACRKLGRERAAICILIIDRNSRLRENHKYHRKFPKASFQI
jgi:replication initiation protein RepC